MKKTDIKRINELATDINEKRSPYAAVENEYVHSWCDNYCLRLSDESLIDRVDSVSNLILICVSKLVMVNAHLIYTMLTDMGVDVTRSAVTRRMQNMAKIGVLTVTEIVMENMSPKNALQLFSVGSRGATVLRSMEVPFYNLRLPALKGSAKLKSLIIAGQTAYALADEILRDVRIGDVLVQKQQNGVVYNIVRLSVVSRADEDYIIEPIRRNGDALDHLSERLNRISIAANKSLSELRTGDWYLKEKFKIIIVCEDDEHIKTVSEKLHIPEDLSDCIYFTTDSKTVPGTETVMLYKYEAKSFDMGFAKCNSYEIAFMHDILQSLLSNEDAENSFTQILTLCNRILLKNKKLQASEYCNMLIQTCINSARQKENKQ